MIPFEVPIIQTSSLLNPSWAALKRAGAALLSVGGYKKNTVDLNQAAKLAWFRPTFKI